MHNILKNKGIRVTILFPFCWSKTIETMVWMASHQQNWVPLLNLCMIKITIVSVSFSVIVSKVYIKDELINEERKHVQSKNQCSVDCRDFFCSFQTLGRMYLMSSSHYYCAQGHHWKIRKFFCVCIHKCKLVNLGQLSLKSTVICIWIEWRRVILTKEAIKSCWI